MNKLEKILPFLYIIVCVLPAVLGLGAVSALLLCGLLAAHFVKNSQPYWSVLVIFSAATMYFALFCNLYFLIAYMAVIVVSALSIGICIKGKKSLTHILITTSMCAVAVFLAIIVYYMKKYGISAVDVVFGTYFNTVETVAKSLGDKSIVITQLIAVLEKQIDLLLPSLIVLAASLFSYISFGVARLLIEKSSPRLNIRPFYLLRLSPSFTFIFVIADLISMFVGGSNILFANVSAVLTTVFVVCGISVLDFHMRRCSINLFLRTVIYVGSFLFVALTGFLGTIAINILHFIGLIDSLRPLRRVDDNEF